MRVTEIFHSLQGERLHQGLACTFIRIGGCSLRCTYCDTKYSWTEWQDQSLNGVLTEVSKYGCDLIQVTGGEPLEEPEVYSLMGALLEKNYKVLLETGGHVSLKAVPKEVIKIMDLKTPTSGECEKNLYENLDFLGAQDEIKFVICNKVDYDWSKKIIQEKLQGFPGTILMSPVTPGMKPQMLVYWILEDKLPVRFQTQLHKALWGNERGK